MARFLVATVPVPAHTRNALPVAARLVDRGHDVSWFASRRFRDDVVAVGAPHVPYGQTRDFDGERLLEEFPQLAGLHGPRAIGRAYADVFVGEAANRVADLSRLLADQPVDAILSDIGRHSFYHLRTLSLIDLRRQPARGGARGALRDLR